MICRCETVTEGEILAALRSPIPPRSVDAVELHAPVRIGDLVLENVCGSGANFVVTCNL